jgi:NADH-quinone oxidoreductase subunit G
VTRVPAAHLNNATHASIQVASVAVPDPVVASIYELDSIVRRSPPLQLTADARMAREGAAA